MSGLRALRLTFGDLWEESWIALSTGIVGGLLSLLVLPLPFVLAAHYALADRLGEERGVTWRSWLQEGRTYAPFFYKWVTVLTLVTVILAASVIFYSRYDALWAIFLRWTMASLLFGWLLIQPFVPALYFRQKDRRLRVALRNAIVLTASDPISALIVWGAVLVIAVPLGYTAWPLLGLLEIGIALLSTRTVRLRLGLVPPRFYTP